MSGSEEKKHRKSFRLVSGVGKPIVLIVGILAVTVLVALGVVSSGIMTKPAVTGLAGVKPFKPRTQPPSAPRVASSSTKVEIEWLPNPYLCRLIIAEQQESREYYRRLAEGQITKFVVRSVQNGGKHVRIGIRAYFIGLGYEDFIAENTIWHKEHFLTATTQGSPLASVASIGPEEAALGARIMRLQHKYQNILRDLAARKIEAVEIRSVDRRLDRSVLDVVIVYRNGTTKSGTIEMEYVNGYWYVMNIKGSNS